MRTRILLLAAALAVGSFCIVAEVQATPAALTPREPFTDVVSVGSNIMGDCGPLGVLELNVTPRDVMTGPDGPMLNGAELDMLIDTTTLCFEDYRFRYSAWN